MARRAQAAMEFLMTYGWAILVLLVAISAFAYFGVYNPQKVLPDKCLFTSGFNCPEYQFQASSNDVNVTFVLQNGLGERIVLQGVNVTLLRNNGNVYNDSDTCMPASRNIDQGATATFKCRMPNALNPNGVGKSAKATVVIKYRKLNGNLTQVAQGELQATVQQG